MSRELVGANRSEVLALVFSPVPHTEQQRSQYNILGRTSATFLHNKTNNRYISNENRLFHKTRSSKVGAVGKAVREEPQDKELTVFYHFNKLPEESMLPCQGQQLEKLIDEALKRSDFHTLEELLRDETSEQVHPKCSKQFINKLDKLINRELDKGNAKHVSLCLSCLHRFGKSLTGPGGMWVSGNGTQGLVKKISVLCSYSVLYSHKA
ncbi:hypothetical protein SKAU_G00095610 [Synaphobranchus kaupii]|uniref:Synaptonemal complex protein 2 armadillo-repeat-like domain-containing protein n=1 Tax=Synaphobranchus kaupii TaxID=118154 RepID=A0A9Q1FXE5_SYNKA|nr:hypothetical protein SKAU_G00095610 [Synaphobranchus kaupii]